MGDDESQSSAGSSQIALQVSHANDYDDDRIIECGRHELHGHGHENVPTPLSGGRASQLDQHLHTSHAKSYGTSSTAQVGATEENVGHSTSRGLSSSDSAFPHPASNISPARTRPSVLKGEMSGSLAGRKSLASNFRSSAVASTSDILEPTIPPVGPHEGTSAWFGKKHPTKVTVVSIDNHLAKSRIQSRTAKGKNSSSLPNYETWVHENTNCSKGLVDVIRFFKRICTKPLGVQAIPLSKNDRQVNVGLHPGKSQIDRRTGKAFIDNTIRSTRYTVWTFLPRQIIAQFSKLANFYFLCVAVLQMIPGLSTTGTYTTIVPLMFFVTISMLKEGLDDFRRHRQDKIENRQVAQVFRADPAKLTELKPSPNICAQWAETGWKDITVGDVVRIRRDESIPADLVLIHVQGIEGIAYFETMALDGETNLKSRCPSPLLAKYQGRLDNLAKCQASLTVEDPNLDLYNFEGKVTIGNESLPLTNDEVVYRGSVLRNTAETIGLVIYSGEECKIRMNAMRRPRVKAPALQAIVNKVVVIIVVFVIVLAIFNTAAYQVWAKSYEKKAWYLTNAAVAFLPILTSFVILFNTMIPLSLYVSLEIVKLFQMLLMNDIEMYDAASNTPMEARTSSINEEMGQVNYIFSDKTGTLTNNCMKFRKMSVAGTAWRHDQDLQQERTTWGTTLEAAASEAGQQDLGFAAEQSHSCASPAETVAIVTSPTAVKPPMSRTWISPARSQTDQQMRRTMDLMRLVQRHPNTIFARKVQLFLLSIALCHTCFPEEGANGELIYQAASPDECALVKAAQELDLILASRNSGEIILKTYPTGLKNEAVLQKYQILDVVEFSSARKRMSIIVRTPDHRICLFCKGADTTVAQLLRLSGLATAKRMAVQLRATSRRGLEAQEALRRSSDAYSRKDSMVRRSLSLHRPSLSGIGRLSGNSTRLQPIRDSLDTWLRQQETHIEAAPRNSESSGYFMAPSICCSRACVQAGSADAIDTDYKPSQTEKMEQMQEEASVADEGEIMERCFQHIENFATEGLRTLLYAYRYMHEDEYTTWKRIYLDASTSLNDRRNQVEAAGALAEHDLELAGATAIEDKLQDGVPETIDRLRRAKIKMWMLTGDKRETAINVGHSCRLIKDYSDIRILDAELGDVSQIMASAMLDLSSSLVAHSVVVVDGKTLAHITGLESLHELFLSLAVLVDTVVCCRASPSQKALLVNSIRSKVKNSITLAIGDGANDIAMIQEAHIGIGITGREGLQAARNSDYSIAQFRFLARLLLVHGRWNYLRTCKYTLGTFWKEFMFYLTQALFQRYVGYTGTSLYESWSLSMFNTLFTSLPVIFIGIFDQDLNASTLMAVPELYSSSGPVNAGFNIKLYLGWIFMASCEAIIIFFVALSLYGHAIFTEGQDLYSVGALTFTACIILIASKMQFLEMHNKTVTCTIAILLSVGGWFLWNIILSGLYTNNVIYDVRDGLLHRFGRNLLWWMSLIIIVTVCWVFEIGVKTAKRTWAPSDVDCFRELQKDESIRARLEQSAGRSSTDEVPLARSEEEQRQREDDMQMILYRRKTMKCTSNMDSVEMNSFDQLRHEHPEHQQLRRG